MGVKFIHSWGNHSLNKRTSVSKEVISLGGAGRLIRVSKVVTTTDQPSISCADVLSAEGRRNITCKDTLSSNSRDLVRGNLYLYLR